LVLRWAQFVESVDLGPTMAAREAGAGRRGRSNVPSVPALPVSALMRSGTWDSNASTLVDVNTPLRTCSIATASTSVSSTSSAGAPTPSFAPKVRQKVASPLDEGKLYKRLGKNAEEGRELLASMRHMVSKLEAHTAMPDLSSYRAMAKNHVDADRLGLSEALRRLDSFAQDFEGEISGTKSFWETRLNEALKKSPPGLWERLKEPQSQSQRLLAQIREAQSVTKDRAKLGDANGEEPGELVKSRAKALKRSLLIGFKAEPSAVDDPKHPLWLLVDELSVPLNPASVREGLASL
jgi:hypothetical protein